MGMFSVQPNNDTRIFEYPWAYDVAKCEKGMKVLDLGGGLAGFQFVLSQEGMQVFNIDPGLHASGKGWRCDDGNISILNKIFSTHVTLINSTIQSANLESNYFDRVFSISVIEHFSERDYVEAIDHIVRVLKPGGLFILTVDLFLDLKPFSSREQNEWGRNFPIGGIVQHSDLELVVGNKKELYGCEEFESDAIMSNLSQYFIGKYYPTLVQCMVLRKRNVARM